MTDATPRDGDDDPASGVGEQDFAVSHDYSDNGEKQPEEEWVTAPDEETAIRRAKHQFDHEVKNPDSIRVSEV